MNFISKFNELAYRVADLIPGNFFSRAMQTYYGPPSGDTSDPVLSDISRVLLICVAPIAFLLVIAVGVGSFFLGKKIVQKSSNDEQNEKRKDDTESNR